jgi:hypothetical protein
MPHNALPWGSWYIARDGYAVRQVNREGTEYKEGTSIAVFDTELLSNNHIAPYFRPRIEFDNGGVASDPAEVRRI